MLAGTNDMETTPQKTDIKKNFLYTHISIMLQMSLFAILLIAAAMTNPVFFDPTNLTNLFYQGVPYAIMALALVLPACVKGIDLSAGAVFATASWVFAYFASENMVVPGLILALAMGFAVGSINGAVNMFIRIPSTVLTMVVSAAGTFGLSIFVNWGAKSLWDGRPIYLEMTKLDVTTVAVVSLFVALVMVLALLYFSKLGGEGHVQKHIVFAAYAGSALLFSLAACYLVTRINAGGPMLADSGYAVYLLFAAGAILMNRRTQKRFMPVLYALVAALNWDLISNILNLNNVSTYYQFILQIMLAAAFITIAFLVQRSSRPRI